MRCSNCGKEFTGNFCPVCGRVSNSSINYFGTNKRGDSARIVGWIILVIAFAIITSFVLLI